MGELEELQAEHATLSVEYMALRETLREIEQRIYEINVPSILEQLHELEDALNKTMREMYGKDQSRKAVEIYGKLNKLKIRYDKMDHDPVTTTAFQRVARELMEGAFRATGQPNV